MLLVSVSGLPVCEFSLWPKPLLVAKHPKERTPKIGRQGKSTAPATTSEFSNFLPCFPGWPQNPATETTVAH